MIRIGVILYDASGNLLQACSAMATEFTREGVTAAVTQVWIEAASQAVACGPLLGTRFHFDGKPEGA